MAEDGAERLKESEDQGNCYGLCPLGISEFL